jgi:putative SOS response-associated peptidase YedK
VFYEWKTMPAGKQPYAIVAADGQPLAMAGLWERWQDRAAADALQSFTIITTAPNELCGAIHDRMPVILQREKWATWLGEHEAGRAAMDDPAAVPGSRDARLSG